MTLKLFVWKDVLKDYTSGIVCILANNLEEAMELLKKEDHTAWWVLNGKPDNRDYKGIYKLIKQPKIITKPEAFVVWGGG